MPKGFPSGKSTENRTTSFPFLQKCEIRGSNVSPKKFLSLPNVDDLESKFCDSVSDYSKSELS